MNCSKSELRAQLLSVVLVLRDLVGTDVCSALQAPDEREAREEASQEVDEPDFMESPGSIAGAFFVSVARLLR